MALSQLVTKTYGRRARQADTSDAARAFDEVFKNDKPVVRAASTSEKWGNTTFKKITTCNSPPKRKMTSNCDSSDPFSFESDDDGKAKKLKTEDTKTCSQNQKVPIVVKINKTATIKKERENRNKHVDYIENLKAKSSIGKKPRDKKKVCDSKKTEKIVNPTVTKRTGHDFTAVHDAEHLQSNQNGPDCARRLLSNGADTKNKTVLEPATDRTLQLECYDITEQEDQTSDHNDAKDAQEFSHLKDHLSALSSTLLNGKKTNVAVPGKELVAEKCEKQAQVFVSRFARLFSPRRLVTGVSSDESGSVNSNSKSVGLVSKELKNNNNQKALTSLKTMADKLTRNSEKQNCLVQTLKDGVTCSSVHVLNDSRENSQSSDVSQASLSVKDIFRRSKNSTVETLDVRKSGKRASVFSHGKKQLTLAESWGPGSQSASLHDSDSDCSVLLLSDGSDSQARANIADGLANSVKTGGKSLRSVASDNLRRSVTENNEWSNKSSESFVLQKNSASSGCSEMFQLSTKNVKLRKSLSDGSTGCSLQITPELHDNFSSEASRTSARKLLTGSKRMMRTKAVYNPRQWNDPHELMSDGSSQTSGSSVKPFLSADSTAVFDDFDVDSVPVRVPPSVNRGSGDAFTRTMSSTSDACSIASSKFMVKKELKPLYTVVHHVKQAHECQEYGETQEFCDDIDYIMDGLSDTQPIATRCLSAISLASKCSTSAFRMHIRAHGTLSKVFSALHDAPDNPSLSLCTSAIMFMMSRDHLAMDIEKSSLQLMLRLLNTDNVGKIVSDHVEYDKIRQRLQVICSPTSVTSSRSRGSKSVSFEDTTPGNLSMETLLSLTSKQAGDWFKDSMRSLGGLEQIINTVCRCIDLLDNELLASIETMPMGCEMLKQLHCVERCIRVLESVSMLNVANQNFLFSYKSSSFVKALHRLLRLLSSHLPHTTVTVVSDDVLDKDQPNYTMAACLVNTLRLLFNIIHDNESTSNIVGQIDGMLDTLLSCTLRSPLHVPVSQRFDLIILGLGLLTNLLESSAGNRSQLIALKSMPPFDHPYQMVESTVDSLEALGMMFSSRYEAAKLVEEEQDAEIEEAERRQKATIDAAHEKAAGKTLGKRKEQAGEWCESDSGLLWHPADSSTLDDSGDGLAALQACRQEAAAMAGNPIGGCSQEDDENYTKVLHTAGKHMEDSIVAAYVALLIGTVIQHNMKFDRPIGAICVKGNVRLSGNLAESVRDTLPGYSFSPMVQMLSKFLGFMNLTRGSGTSASKSIQKIIDVLEAC